MISFRFTYIHILKSNSRATGSNLSATNKAIIGTTVGSVLAVMALCIFLGLRRRKRTNRHQVSQAMERDQTTTERDREFSAEDYEFDPSAEFMNPIFTLNELKEASRNFHPDNKLGQGGFGPVYKGTLANGRDVAIKLLSSVSRQGRREFMNEVNLITSVQHRNLIKLLGCCAEGSERLLVYEYLPNKSLDKHLFDSEDSLTLDWRARLEIIVGTARGLAYLHEDSRVRIVHRDIKAGNILLDDNLHPKIADFGLARLLSIDESHVSTKVAGTLGYLAPEYAMHGQLTEKADVFSFGVVALEVVSGRKNTDVRLLELTWRLYEEQRQMELVDQRLGNDFVPEEVIRVVHAALLCTQAIAGLRPTMSKVMGMLSGRSQILEIPTQPPYIDNYRAGSQSSSSSGNLPTAYTQLIGNATGRSAVDTITEIAPR